MRLGGIKGPKANSRDSISKVSKRRGKMPWERDVTGPPVVQGKGASSKVKPYGRDSNETTQSTGGVFPTLGRRT